MSWFGRMLKGNPYHDEDGKFTTADNAHTETKALIDADLAKTFMGGQRPSTAHLTKLIYTHSQELQDAKAKTEAAKKAYGEVAGVSPEASLSPKALELEAAYEKAKAAEAKLLREIRKVVKPKPLTGVSYD